jgi:hypothetical protein
LCIWASAVCLDFGAIAGTVKGQRWQIDRGIGRVVVAATAAEANKRERDK